MPITRVFQIFALIMLPFLASAESFKISDIRIEGLQKVSAGSVFAALPLNVGDTASPTDLQEVTRSLFKTGFFDDIELGREGDVLVINVTERPAIASISFDGNKSIETEQLEAVLENAGLSEGRIFRRATLEGIASELERQYVAQGRYGAEVETVVEELPRNRVALNINIKEGKIAAIKQINIVGNTVFEEDDLLDLFELDTTGWLSWLNNEDKYSKEKIEGDIERLTSYYMDRGYLQFSVDSTQVSLSPNKKAIYITVNITEGAVYTVKDVDLAGELIVPEEEMRRLILMQPGNTFSQVQMTTTSEWMKQRLGNEGYTYTEVEELTEIDEGDKTVSVTFYVNPGERTYVRRINFRGNTKTADEVLRREMRQLEGATASTYKIEQSKVRLQRLGYFSDVDMEMVEVPGTGDQVDLEYTVEELPSGSIGASVGYAQGTGMIFGANIQQDNFLGSGKRIGFELSRSDYKNQVSFNYLDPYYTPDGVSRGFEVYWIERDLEEVNVSDYSVDTYGVNMTFGYPLSEIQRINFGIGYAHNDISVGSLPAQEIFGTPFIDRRYTQYVNQSDLDNCITNGIPAGCTDIDDYDLVAAGLLNPVTEAVDADSPEGFLNKHGDDFDDFTLRFNWKKSTLNRGRLATRGQSQTVSAEMTVPGSDLEYWKLKYDAQFFRPLTRSLTLRMRTSLGVGDSYGGTSGLPFFENFFGGGFGSVRGYKRNTLGPHDTPARYLDTRGVPSSRVGGVNTGGLVHVCDDSSGACRQLTTYHPDWETNPFGGSVKIEGSFELIFPMPFFKDSKNMQPSVFLDVGNVFDLDCGDTQRNCFDVDFGELRYSVGVGLTWITGFGPLSFSIAKPFNDSNFDEPETFQFSMGQLF